MRNRKQQVLLGLVAIAIVIVVFLMMFHRVDQKHIEVTSLILCEGRQQRVYGALVKYESERGELPSDLSILVREGYVMTEDVLCPVDLRKASALPYHYFPGSFGHPESVLISDRVGSHAGVKVLSDTDATMVTMGDGKVWCMINPDSARSVD